MPKNDIAILTGETADSFGVSAGVISVGRFSIEGEATGGSLPCERNLLDTLSRNKRVHWDYGTQSKGLHGLGSVQHTTAFFIKCAMPVRWSPSHATHIMNRFSTVLCVRYQQKTMSYLGVR